MIREFSVENFLSFGSRQTISFEAKTSDKKYLDELTVKMDDGVRLSRIAMVYGANASGKTNLLIAIQAVWRMLFYSRPTKDKTTESYKPFALRNGEPTVFDIMFYKGDIKHEYHIEYDKDNIITEELNYYPNGSRALFYKRHFNEIKFGDIGLNKEVQLALRLNTLNNHTVLSTFSKTNIGAVGTKVEELYMWIWQNIHELDTHSNLVRIIEDAAKNSQLRDYLLQELQVSDFNISDFKVVESPMYSREDIDSLPESARERLVSAKRKDVLFTHRTKNGFFDLKAGMESLGTQKSISLIRKFYDLQNSSCVHLIDELGEGLHFDLFKNSLLRFISNSPNSQLIFTTHNQLLLDEDFVRRDMVWLVEKSRETAETELIPVTSYSLHPNNSLFRAYNIGKLGAKPVLGSTLIVD